MTRCRNIFSPNLELKDIDEIEIARQLTLIDFGIFIKISVSEIPFISNISEQHMTTLTTWNLPLLQPPEFLNKGWLDPDMVSKFSRKFRL
jgi:hypothetical protein